MTNKNRWENIGIHWTGGGGPYTTVSQIRAWHKQRGWRDIGYHRVIVHPLLYAHKYKIDSLIPSDLIKLGRDLDNDLSAEKNEIPAAIRGHNHDTLAICVVAGLQSPAHALQIEALELCVNIFRERYQIDRKNVRGHKEFSGHESNQCPGLQIINWIQDYRKGILA